eukprot:m.82996 g.82996  ORF g.82996 m.82996 type:complete len:113 (+) comp8681_c1_seq3:1136-1474(+)
MNIMFDSYACILMHEPVKMKKTAYQRLTGLCKLLVCNTTIATKNKNNKQFQWLLHSGLASRNRFNITSKDGLPAISKDMQAFANSLYLVETLSNSSLFPSSYNRSNVVNKNP